MQSKKIGFLLLVAYYLLFSLMLIFFAKTYGRFAPEHFRGIPSYLLNGMWWFGVVLLFFDRLKKDRIFTIAFSIFFILYGVYTAYFLFQIEVLNFQSISFLFFIKYLESVLVALPFITFSPIAFLISEFLV